MLISNKEIQQNGVEYFLAGGGVETPKDPPLETPEDPPLRTPNDPPLKPPEDPPLKTPQDPPLKTPEPPLCKFLFRWYGYHIQGTPADRLRRTRSFGGWLSFIVIF